MSMLGSTAEITEEVRRRLHRAFKYTEILDKQRSIPCWYTVTTHLEHSDYTPGTVTTHLEHKKG